jgi:tricarballylate dehydrogenase
MSVEKLARKLSIVPANLRNTIDSLHNAIFGEKALNLVPVKSNFAQRIDRRPFYAYPVTGGMTFTFGGIKINERAEVVDKTGKSIPGVYAAGEVTGGFFYNNYPAGSSLTRCAVFGEIAGNSAAAYVKRIP